MKKFLLTAILFHLTLNSIFSQYVPIINSPDPNKGWDYVSSLSDEFNSSSIDWTNKFFLNTNLPNVNAWKWNNAANVTIVNNAAQISMKHNENNIPVNGTYFNSGILKTKGTFTTGYVEARIKGAVINIPGTDNGRGVCPSFWLYSDFDRTVAEEQTIYCEIDVVELQQFDYYNGVQDNIYDMEHNLHLVRKINAQDVWFRPKANASTQKTHSTATFNPTSDYHIYGCEVTTTQITWYVDGVQVGSKPNTYWYRPMNITLSLGLRVPFVQFVNNVFEPINPITDARANKQLPAIPTSMSVDYVRVWTSKTPLSIPTQNKPTGFILYPNPTNQEVLLELGENSNPTQINLVSPEGKILFNQTTNDSKVILNTSTYSKGIYILKINNSSKTYSQKLIIK